MLHSFIFFSQRNKTQFFKENDGTQNMFVIFLSKHTEITQLYTKQEISDIQFSFEAIQSNVIEDFNLHGCDGPVLGGFHHLKILHKPLPQWHSLTSQKT
jgi:hypothetical protein